MGIEMKKVALLATALAMVTTGSAFAADMAVKAKKAPPVVAFDPWDIAFGGAIMTDYNFRGVSQSNKGASGGAYFEPQLNTPYGQFYVGLAAWSIDCTSAGNRSNWVSITPARLSGTGKGAAEAALSQRSIAPASPAVCEIKVSATFAMNSGKPSV